MNRLTFLSVITIALLCACLAGAQLANLDERAHGVSLIRLIANPRTFEGHRLRLQGYLYYNGVDRAVGLYVSESDARNAIFSNSIDLAVEDSSIQKLLDKYVILEGTYHAPKGPSSDYLNGHVDHVSQLKAWAQGDPSK